MVKETCTMKNAFDFMVHFKKEKECAWLWCRKNVVKTLMDQAFDISFYN